MRRIGQVLFWIGIVLSAIFYGFVFWGNFEALWFDYDSALISEKPLTTLRCPLVLAADEGHMVSAVFTNPSEREVRRVVSARIAERYLSLMREDRFPLTLGAGESRRLEWPVSGSDAVWKRFVLVRVSAQRSSPLPSQTKTCGIIVFPLSGLRGVSILTAWVLAALVCGGIGSKLWLSQLPSRIMQRFLALVALALVGIVAGLLHLWLMGGVILVVSLVWCVVILAVGAAEKG